MTPQQKFLVQDTWHRVLPSADRVAITFYDRLFERDPHLLALFAGVDMAVQRQKLLQALAAVVGALHHVEDILPQLEDLGRRHADYNVTEEHYEAVGAALLWTLEKELGEAWTAEVESAWAVAYGLVAGTMQAAARSASPQQAERVPA